MEEGAFPWQTVPMLDEVRHTAQFFRRSAWRGRYVGVVANRIGIDLGGTKTEGVVLGPDRAVVARKRVATDAGRGYQHIVETVGALIDDLRLDAPGCSVVGIGTPGARSQRTGLMKNSNTQCLNGRDLLSDLRARLDCDVLIENDANCFALAEAGLGVARDYGVVFGVILGTGVGGGIVFHGRPHTGAQAIAGEWGHHSIDPAGPSCYCGNRGCVEAYLSGPALAAAYRAESGDEVDAATVVARARAGDASAEVVFARYLDVFGRSLANVIDILDPDAVVLGGGLSNIDELYSVGRDRVAQRVFSDELATPILRNVLGDSAGVFGAALLGSS